MTYAAKQVMPAPSHTRSRSFQEDRGTEPNRTAGTEQRRTEPQRTARTANQTARTAKSSKPNRTAIILTLKPSRTPKLPKGGP